MYIRHVYIILPCKRYYNALAMLMYFLKYYARYLKEIKFPSLKCNQFKRNACNRVRESRDAE